MFPVRPAPQLAAAFFITLAAPAGIAQAQAGAQSGASMAQRYDLPAAPLAETLTRIARQSGHAVSVDPALVAGRQAPAVAGTYTPEQALRQALAGSGLELRITANGTFSARPLPQAGGATLLEPVRVTGAAESPSGPLHGYAARVSATGTKTDTPIIETPQSITVVGAEEIETLKAQSLQDALGYVAGVSRAEGLDRTTDSLFLRGFRTDLGNFYRDGTLYTVNVYNGRQEPYGLERVEYLKGAASILYGASPPGGVINTVSKRPTREPLRELNVDLGNFDRKQISGDFGGALDDAGVWSYRLTALRRDSNSFIDHVPDDRTYVAPALKWQPSAATSLTLLAEYQKDRTLYAYGLPAQGTVLPNINGRIPRDRYPGEPDFDKFELERYSIGYLFEHAFNSQLTLRQNARYFNAKSHYAMTSLSPWPVPSPH